ncbi:MAG: DUF3784 domain-containing protein [Oscillospiraceae bacterium]|nr:DUF3784 domain-containing protein [Oscillospiraceae bacterium]
MSAFLGATALLLFIISHRQHREKGFIFTNTWLMASQKEREEMDDRIKKAEYRVGRNVFFLLGLIFFVLAVFCLSLLSWLLYVLYALTAVTCIYAIVQWITNERLYKTFKDKKD